MTLWQNLLDALQSIRANSLRSFLAILSIAIGVAALITMLSVGVGAQTQIAEQIRSLGANVLIILPGAEGGARGPDGARTRNAPLTVDDAKAAATIPDVAAAAPALQLHGRLVYGNRNWPTRINGTTADYFFVRDWPLAAGRGFSAREEARAGKVALIGATAALRLFGEADPVGQEIRVQGVPMRVIGLLSPKGQSGSGRDQDDILFVPYKTARLRLGAEDRGIIPDEVTYILVKATSDAAVGRAKEDIEGLLRQRNGVLSGAPAGFRVTEPAAAMAARQGSTRTLGWLLAAVASISLVVGGISIMNIMLVSVTERTREIGLRQALGANRRDIGWLFLSEALVICLIGAAFGVAMGAGSALLLAGLTGWPILVAPSTVLAALLFAVMTGLIFGYYPARRASAMLPAAALRSD